jgi:hypothetical protein
VGGSTQAATTAGGDVLTSATDPFVTLERDLRWYRLTLFNRGRMRSGTASAYRYVRTLEAIKARWPGCKLTPKGHEPIMVRSRVAGPVVLILDLLRG